MADSEAAPGTPREVLFEYFRELLALNAFAVAEAHAAEQLRREPDLDDLRARRAAIRNRFCTPRRRKTDGVVAYGPLEAQAYDPANLVVRGEDQQSATQAQITVHNRALGEHWKYLLVLRGGRWLIDSLQFRDGRKWVPVPLH
jgi:hypothetical protein